MAFSLSMAEKRVFGHAGRSFSGICVHREKGAAWGKGAGMQVCTQGGQLQYWGILLSLLLQSMAGQDLSCMQPDLW